MHLENLKYIYRNCWKYDDENGTYVDNQYTQRKYRIHLLLRGEVLTMETATAQLSQYAIPIHFKMKEFAFDNIYIN